LDLRRVVLTLDRERSISRSEDRHTLQTYPVRS
jgi:hypothetical protein